MNKSWKVGIFYHCVRLLKKFTQYHKCQLWHLVKFSGKCKCAKATSTGSFKVTACIYIINSYKKMDVSLIKMNSSSGTLSNLRDVESYVRVGKSWRFEFVHLATPVPHHTLTNSGNLPSKGLKINQSCKITDLSCIIEVVKLISVSVCYSTQWLYTKALQAGNCTRPRVHSAIRELAQQHQCK